MECPWTARKETEMSEYESNWSNKKKMTEKRKEKNS
jgi:hypothetical protein